MPGRLWLPSIRATPASCCAILPRGRNRSVFAPHRDFAAVEQVFGDVSADASDAVFRFGRDGKPVYIPGPTETAPLIQRRIEQLQKHLGDDGFGFETAA